MRFCVLIALAALVFGASDTFAMGKSDGNDKKVKSAVKADACCSVEKAECSAEQKAKCDAEGKKCGASCDKKKGECTAEQKAKCAAEGKTCDASCSKNKAECTAEQKAKCDAGDKKCDASCAGKKVADAEKKVEAVKSEAKPAVKIEKPAVAVKSVTPVPKVDELWLTVNGTEIRESKIDEVLAGQFANMEKSGRKLPDEMKDTFRRQAAQKMIVEVLVEQKIAEKKITSTDEEVNGRLSEMAEQQGMDLEKFLEMAKTQGGIEPDELKRRVKMGMGFEKLMDIEAAGEDMTVTEEVAKEYYDKNIQQFTKPEQVRASHVLIMTKGKDEAGKAEAKKKIDGILKEAKEGSDFAELAKLHSEDPGSKDKGGEYTFGRGKMVPAFEEAAFSLEVDGISDVVETEYGYHIIKLSEKLPGGVTSFEDAKEMIIANEQGKKKQQFSGKYFEKITKESNIVWAKEAPAPRQPRPAMPVRPKKADDAKPVEEKK